MPALIPFPVSMTHEYILKPQLCEGFEQADMSIECTSEKRS